MAAKTASGRRVGGLCPLQLVLAVAVLTLAASTVALGADSGAVGEYQVKAAFLYNFARFVEWPRGAASPGNGPIVVGVLGTDPFGAILDFTFEDKVLAGRRFQVRRYRSIEELRDCHILFVSSSERANLARTFGTVGGEPVLTVGDTRGFAREGGIIELLLEDNKIRFDINLNEAKRSGLRISAQLLQLARQVQGK